MSAFKTPMLRQYKAIKDQHPDTVLLFRLGDFYELFDADARTVSALLSLTLTGRGKAPNRVDMCGMPYHAADKYIKQLVDHGYKVALCEQTEAADEKPGLTERGVVQIITPGTVFEDSSNQHNFLISFCEFNKKISYSLADVGTGGSCYCGFLNDEAQIPNVVARYQAREIVIDDTVTISTPLPHCIVTQRDTLTETQIEQYVSRVFGDNCCERFGLDSDQLASIALLMSYIHNTQYAQANHITRIQRQYPDDTLIMDYATLDTLGLVHHQKPDSLFQHMNRTQTRMGARYLQQRMMMPYRSPNAMETQWNSIQALLNASDERQALRQALRGVSDLNRLATKISQKTQNPRDCIALAETLTAIASIAAELQDSDTQLANARQAIEHARSTWLTSVIEHIQATVVSEPPVHIKQGGTICTGCDAELDALMDSFQSIRNWINTLEATERAATGIQTLKVGYNKVFGYYIECSNRATVPEHYIRKQTLTNAERYITAELKEKETILLTGQEQQVSRETCVYNQLIDALTPHVAAMQALAQVIAQLDVIQSLATVAHEYGYTRPHVLAEPVLHLSDSYHPILARQSDMTFISNSVTLSHESGNLGLITGPNMAGKSTIMRQVAVCIVMAQMGSFVPASVCQFGPVDHLFTRIGAMDNLYAGHSTFMVEMLESAAILNQATENSLILLDEIGRGTATYDGLSLATAMTHYIHNTIGARTLFATHYHELVELTQDLPRVRCYKMGVVESESAITFTYQLEIGHANRSYGIHVATMAGLPDSVIQHARTIMGSLTDTAS
jgi:DNA mismatch repair protein MutS